MTKVVALVIIAIVLLASVLKPYVSAASTANVKVGVYYYVWYGNGSTGLGTPHWNDSSSGIVVDTPDIGFYDSNSNVTLYNQLKQMTDINISFVLISWWGAGNFTDSSKHYIDDNAKKVFQTIKDNNLSIQAAILFEPFNQSSGVYNFPLVYDYIYDTFVTPFQTIYFHFLDKPLIVLYNDENSTPNGTYPKDDRFTTRISGHENYADWVYWSFDDQSSMPQPYIPRGQPVCKDEEIDVCPRYDDSHLRSHNSTFDVTYEQGYYGKQWNKAIAEANSGNVTIVMISTWNEYHERTQIEPCNDSTSAYNNASYIYNLTDYYIDLLYTIPEFPSFLIPSLFIIVTVTLLAIIVYRKKHAKSSGTP